MIINRYKINYNLVNFYQVGGYKHKLYLISNSKKGTYQRNSYLDWDFLNELKVINKNKGLMLDLHNVTDTMWIDKKLTINEQSNILQKFIVEIIKKYKLEKVVICSWVGNIDKFIGKNVIDLLTTTWQKLDNDSKSKFVGIAIDTRDKKKKDYMIRQNKNLNNEKTSPKSQLADYLNLGLLIDDSIVHLPDKYHKVNGFYFDLKRSFDKNKLNNRKYIDYFDINEFTKLNIKKEQALPYVLDLIYEKN